MRGTSGLYGEQVKPISPEPAFKLSTVIPVLILLFLGSLIGWIWTAEKVNELEEVLKAQKAEIRMRAGERDECWQQIIEKERKKYKHTPQ